MATIGKWRRSSRRSSLSGIFAASSPSASVSELKTLGMPCLWMAIRLKARGASGSPSTSVTLTPERGERPAGSASTRLPASAPPRSAMSVAERVRLSTGASQALPAPSISTTPSTCSDAVGSFFIGWAIQPEPASSVRARTRSPRFRAACFPLSIRRSRGGGLASSGCQVSGIAKASPSSISTTRSTVTRGTPPMRWKALFLPSIRPSSAMSLSRALSWIFSCPLSPKARAISRLPAGVGELAMKSRTCWREGRPGCCLGFAGIAPMWRLRRALATARTRKHPVSRPAPRRSSRRRVRR